MRVVEVDRLFGEQPLYCLVQYPLKLADLLRVVVAAVLANHSFKGITSSSSSSRIRMMLLMIVAVSSIIIRSSSSRSRSNSWERVK